MGKRNDAAPRPKPKAKGKEKEKVEEVVEDAATKEQREKEEAEMEARKQLYLKRKNAQKWADASLESIRKLVEKANKGKILWLEACHEFHEKKLIKLSKAITEKTADEAPQELRDGFDAYLKQMASGYEVKEESFKKYEEIWNCIDADGGAFKRAPETPEAEAAIKTIKEWSGMGVEDIKNLTDLLKKHSASPGAQEAGMNRIGYLYSLLQKGSPAEGLQAEVLMPCIRDAMEAHLADPDVQRAGCGALRGVAIAQGQLPILVDNNGIKLAVEALKVHYKIKDVCQAANGAFWAMTQATSRNSPEISKMRTGGVEEVLAKVMTHHAWDQTLCGKVRLTLPFLSEDLVA